MENEKELTPYEPELLSFDPIVLVRDVLKRWLLIVVVAVCVGVGAYIYADYSYTPMYKSSATLVVTNRSTATTVYDNLSSTSELAGVFGEVLNSSILRKKVLEEVGITSFGGSISASTISNTNLLTITVTSGDPKLAFQVLQAVLEHHDVLTYQILGNITLDVLQNPTVASAPYNSSDAMETMCYAMIAAAVVVCGILLLMSLQRDAVRSRKEAESKLNCWCLGEIQHERKRMSLKDLLTRKKKSILVTNPETSFGYITAVGRLCRRIEQHMHGGKVLMITSIMENEGKSTVAVNIALSMAAKNKRVLLVDGDLHKPACRKILEHDVPAHYLSEVVEGTVSLAEAVEIDKRSGMDVLYSKNSSVEESARIVSSMGMARLLEQARQSYDFVVIDQPPMSMTTDPETMMELADASVLVTCQNVPTARALNRAIAALQRGRAKLLGCVLNNVRSTFLTKGDAQSVANGAYGFGYNGYNRGEGYSKYGRYGKYGKYGAYAKRAQNGGVDDGK